MRSLNKLTVKLVESLSEPGRYGDGGGLNLIITKAGTRQWIFRYRWEGREREMGLGSAATGRVTLATARKMAQAARDLLAEGKDPQAVKRASKESSRKVRLFGQVADEYLKTMSKGWRNAKHKAQWERSLKELAAPLRSTPVHLIDTPKVIEVLQPYWSEVPETARRLRGRIENVLGYAIAHNYRAEPNPARWKDNLKGLLSRHDRLSRRHHAALPYEQMPTFMAALRQRQADNDTPAAYALELTILTVLRTSEVLGGKYPEFDLLKKLWTVPPGRMKMKVEHRVPLSPRAVEIVEKLMETRWGDYLFPGNVIDRHLSNMSMLMLLRRMGYENITVHGFRSSFKDWCSEATSFPFQISEMALAHQIEDDSERAYRRGDLLTKRTKLMNAWANFIEPKSGSNVVPLSQGAKH